MDAFWHQWLGGFSEGVRALDSSARDALASSCGRACAAPEVLPRMRQLLEECGKADVFFRSINGRMTDIRVVERIPGLLYDFIYAECGCPLYTQQGLRDPFLCECSRHSLSWVMGELFPENQPRVTLLEGILRGDLQCRLRVAFPISLIGCEACASIPEAGIPEKEVHRSPEHEDG